MKSKWNTISFYGYVMFIPNPLKTFLCCFGGEYGTKEISSIFKGKLQELGGSEKRVKTNILKNPFL
jgi:hypothetical protein